MKPTPPAQVEGPDPAAYDRHLRRCIRGAIRDLRASIASRRTLSLPNLCRLFARRWRNCNLPEHARAQGLALGSAFLRKYYSERQPFRPRPHRAVNGTRGR